MLRRADELGLKIELQGIDKLRWKAKRQPPPGLLAELREHKAEIIAFLSRPSARKWTAAEAIEADLQHEFISGQLPVVDAAPVRSGMSKPWNAADYKALFDERAAILEFDGGLTRLEAEARAVEHCVVEWLNRHPSSSPAGHCAWCGSPESAGAAVVPFGVGERHTWLHPGCWREWHRRRRADALAALRSIGVPVPELPWPTGRIAGPTPA
jgi:hypothetical protein